MPCQLQRRFLRRLGGTGLWQTNLSGSGVAAWVRHPAIGPSLLSNIESSGQSG